MIPATKRRPSADPPALANLRTLPRLQPISSHLRRGCEEKRTAKAPSTQRPRPTGKPFRPALPFASTFTETPMRNPGTVTSSGCGGCASPGPPGNQRQHDRQPQHDRFQTDPDSHRDGILLSAVSRNECKGSTSNNSRLWGKIGRSCFEQPSGKSQARSPSAANFHIARYRSQ